MSVDINEESTKDLFSDEVVFKREEAAAIDNQIVELAEKREQLLKEAVHLCKHPVESLYELPHELHTSEPEWVICKDCGLTEIGWGVGHKALKNSYNLPRISFQTWCKWRTVMVREEDKYKWR